MFKIIKEKYLTETIGEGKLTDYDYDIDYENNERTEDRLKRLVDKFNKLIGADDSHLYSGIELDGRCVAGAPEYVRLFADFARKQYKDLCFDLSSECYWFVEKEDLEELKDEIGRQYFD